MMREKDVLSAFTGTIRCSADPREQDAWCQRILSDAEKQGTMPLGMATMPYVLPTAVASTPSAIALVFPDRPGAAYTSTGRGCTCLLLQAHQTRGYPMGVEQVLASPSVLKAYAPPATDPQVLRAAAGGRVLTGLCDVSTINLNAIRRHREVDDIKAVLFNTLTEIPSNPQSNLPSTDWVRVPLGQKQCQFAAACAFAGLSVFDTIRKLDEGVLKEWQRRQQAQELILLQQQITMQQHQQMQAPPALPLAPPVGGSQYDSYPRMGQGQRELGPSGAAAFPPPGGAAGSRWAGQAALDNSPRESHRQHHPSWRGRSPPPGFQQQQPQQRFSVPSVPQQQYQDATYADPRARGGGGYAAGGAWDATAQQQQPMNAGGWGDDGSMGQAGAAYGAPPSAVQPMDIVDPYSGYAARPGSVGGTTQSDMAEILGAFEAGGAGGARQDDPYSTAYQARGYGQARQQQPSVLPEIRLPMAGSGNPYAVGAEAAASAVPSGIAARGGGYPVTPMDEPGQVPTYGGHPQGQAAGGDAWGARADGPGQQRWGAAGGSAGDARYGSTAAGQRGGYGGDSYDYGGPGADGYGDAGYGAPAAPVGGYAGGAASMDPLMGSGSGGGGYDMPPGFDNRAAAPAVGRYDRDGGRPGAGSGRGVGDARGGAFAGRGGRGGRRGYDGAGPDHGRPSDFLRGGGGYDRESYDQPSQAGPGSRDGGYRRNWQGEPRGGGRGDTDRGGFGGRGPSPVGGPRDSGYAGRDRRRSFSPQRPFKRQGPAPLPGRGGPQGGRGGWGGDLGGPVGGRGDRFGALRDGFGGLQGSGGGAPGRQQWAGEREGGGREAPPRRGTGAVPPAGDRQARDREPRLGVKRGRSRSGSPGVRSPRGPRDDAGPLHGAPPRQRGGSGGGGRGGGASASPQRHPRERAQGAKRDELERDGGERRGAEAKGSGGGAAEREREREKQRGRAAAPSDGGKRLERRPQERAGAGGVGSTGAGSGGRFKVALGEDGRMHVNFIAVAPRPDARRAQEKGQERNRAREGGGSERERDREKDRAKGAGNAAGGSKRDDRGGTGAAGGGGAGARGPSKGGGGEQRDGAEKRGPGGSDRGPQQRNGGDPKRLRTEGQKAEGHQKGVGQKAEGQKAEGDKADEQKAEGRKAEGQKADGQKAEGQSAKPAPCRSTAGAHGSVPPGFSGARRDPRRQQQQQRRLEQQQPMDVDAAAHSNPHLPQDGNGESATGNTAQAPAGDSLEFLQAATATVAVKEVGAAAAVAAEGMAVDDGTSTAAQGQHDHPNQLQQQPDPAQHTESDAPHLQAQQLGAQGQHAGAGGDAQMDDGADADADGYSAGQLERAGTPDFIPLTDQRQLDAEVAQQHEQAAQKSAAAAAPEGAAGLV